MSDADALEAQKAAVLKSRSDQTASKLTADVAPAKLETYDSSNDDSVDKRHLQSFRLEQEHREGRSQASFIIQRQISSICKRDSLTVSEEQKPSSFAIQGEITAIRSQNQRVSKASVADHAPDEELVKTESCCIDIVDHEKINPFIETRPKVDDHASPDAIRALAGVKRDHVHHEKINRHNSARAKVDDHVDPKLLAAARRPSTRDHVHHEKIDHHKDAKAKVDDQASPELMRALSHEKHPKVHKSAERLSTCAPPHRKLHTVSELKEGTDVWHTKRGRGVILKPDNPEKPYRVR